MSLFKKLFGIKTEKTKEQYLAGWEVVLNGGDHYQSFSETQQVDKETAEKLQTYIQLIYGDDDLLKAVKFYSDGTEETTGHMIDRLQIEQAIGNMKYKDQRINKLYDFAESPDGVHHLGGRVPAHFQIPENTCPGSFQYVGMISNKDEVFQWLPFDLHMICPIYLDIDKVWIDYSDPYKPEVLNAKEINTTGSAYDDLKSGSEIIFKQVNYNTVPADQYGIAGVPNWVQYPDIPRSPKNGKTMRFVCGLPSNIGITTEQTNVHPKDEWYKKYFAEMNFWGDGDLFVFFEPESKIACYFIQNT